MRDLSDRELALLHTRFVMPVVVGQILRGDETLDDASEYALNAVLSELQPDTALLCIALCAQHIAAHNRRLAASPILRATADKIIGEYGALWLAQDKDPAYLDAATVTEALGFIPEDLDDIAHLLDAVHADITDRASPAARLCDILSIQAQDHVELSERQLARLPVIRPRAAGNVVAFPLRQSVEG